MSELSEKVTKAFLIFPPSENKVFHFMLLPLHTSKTYLPLTNMSVLKPLRHFQRKDALFKLTLGLTL